MFQLNRTSDLPALIAVVVGSSFVHYANDQLVSMAWSLRSSAWVELLSTVLAVH